MGLEDLPAALDVGVGDDDVAVEAAGADEGLVEGLGEVGGGDHDDALVLLEAVQLHEQLVEGHLHVLLVLGVAAPADGVNLVDEDDAGRSLLRRREEVPHSASPHAHEHLLELAAAAGEEGDPRLPRDRPGQHGLPRPRRAHQQHALRQLPPQAREPLMQ